MIDPAVVRRKQTPFAFGLGSLVVSTLGDAVLSVGLAFVAIQLTGRASAVGILLAAELLPQACLLTVGGALGDIFGARRVIVAADSVRMITQGTSGVLLLTHHATFAGIVALQAGYGVANALYQPSWIAFCAAIAAGERVQQRNAYLSIGRSATTLIGPAVGAGLLAISSPGALVLADAVSFGLSAATVLLSPRAETALVVERPRVFAMLREGWQEFRKTTWIWRYVAYFALYQALVLAGFQVLGPVVAIDRLGGSAALAFILAARGVGAIVAGLVATLFQIRRRLFVGTLTMMVCDVPLFITLGFTSSTLLISAGAFLAGFGNVYFSTMWDVTFQLQVPVTSIARLRSYDQLGSIALAPVGLVLLGALSDAVSIAALCAAVATIHVVTSLALLGTASRVDASAAGASDQSTVPNLPVES